MPKIILATLFILIYLFTTGKTLAFSNSFISVVNPVRGLDFWDSQQDVKTAVNGQWEIIKQNNTPATWLLRFDALSDPNVYQIFKKFPANQETGLLLEVTPTWTNASGVKYRQSAVWHNAGSVFLTGYEQAEREKLLDIAFSKFKENFGFYPKSVGAWWIDSYSLNYIQKKYDVAAALIVSDQYTTDNYQIWGQYWATPYYPDNKNALIPAQDGKDKIPVVLMQWAARDPVNGYGDGVQESTYSVQANDYIDYHKLGIDYFNELIDTYTIQRYNQFNHLVVGLENSYSWEKYGGEYKNQITQLVKRERSGQLKLVTMGEFSQWYIAKFPTISSSQIIVANDPLGTDKKSVWFMNPYYRVGWFFNKDGSIIRDVRQYVRGQEEPCFSKSCTVLNFATFATRVLDDVTYGKKLVVDQGKITDFKVVQDNDVFAISYRNAAGKTRQIKFYPRDISIDNKISSIDSFILDTLAAQENESSQVVLNSDKASLYKENVLAFTLKIIKFVLFVIFIFLIPGLFIVKKLKVQNPLWNFFLSICLGVVLITLTAYGAGYLKMPWLTYVVVVAFNATFLITNYQDIKNYFKNYSFANIFKKLRSNYLVILVILAGVIFQSLAMMRSGWFYNFGVGYFGPTGHDGIWHQALIYQLVSKVPPENPAFSGQLLSNYHYFYDLLIAVSYRISAIPILDLLYRFFPLLFSVLLGTGTYLLIKKYTSSKLAILASLFFIYFAGSFGWVVSLLKHQPLGGESAFWMNQPISMNLNPPFATSLVLIIAVILLLSEIKNIKHWLVWVALVIIVGSLIEFKVYAGVIVLFALGMVAVYQLMFQKNFKYLLVLIGAGAVSAIVFLPQNSGSGGLLEYSPFWFIHSMVDFSDRVGWLKLSQAREAYFLRGEWLKFGLSETIGLSMFIIGNLGMRFVSVALLFKFIKRGLWKLPEISFIFWVGFASLIIPIFFIQKGNNWNTIQFGYYLLYFTALAAGLVVAIIYKKLPKYIFYAFLLIILVITPISAFTTFNSYLYPTPPSRLSVGEFEALDFLSKQDQGVILTYSYDKDLKQSFVAPYPLLAYETTAYVAAFSGKPTFLEDEIQQQILQAGDGANLYEKRMVAVNEFFNSRDYDWSTEFLKDNNIKYLYLPKIYNISLEWDKLELKQIFENREAQIYQSLI